MDEQTRYRATGSLFLLALAIICLPMIFDGKGKPPMKIEPLDVPATEPEVPAMSAAAPDADLSARVAELKAQVDDEGFYADSGARVGEPVLTEPNDSTRIWAVQVASFQDPARARAMRDELRTLGYEAFLSTVKQNDNVLNRVAVGPLLSESDAESLRDKLSKEVEESARLMAFSN